MHDIIIIIIIERQNMLLLGLLTVLNNQRARESKCLFTLLKMFCFALHCSIVHDLLPIFILLYGHKTKNTNAPTKLQEKNQ